MGGQQYQNPQQPPVPHKTIPAEAGISQSYATNNTKIHPQTYRFPRGPFLRRQESQLNNSGNAASNPPQAANNAVGVSK